MIPLRRWVILRSVACCAAIVVTAFGAQTPQKKIIHSLEEVPSVTYTIGGTAEELLTSDAATFAGLTSKVRPDLELVFRDYDIQDHATMLNLLLHQLDLQMLAGEDQEALKTCEQIPVFADQPDVKAMGCLNDTAFLKRELRRASPAAQHSQKNMRGFCGRWSNPCLGTSLQTGLRGERRASSR